MTDPVAQPQPHSGARFADCTCGEPRHTHFGHALAPQCIIPGSTCLKYRPAVKGAKPSTAPPALRRPPMKPAPVRTLSEPPLVEDLPKRAAGQYEPLPEPVRAAMDKLADAGALKDNRPPVEPPVPKPGPVAHSADCSCSRCSPAVPPVSLVTDGSIESVLRLGKASGYDRTRQLTAKIGGLVHDLRSRLLDEREDKEAKLEQARKVSAAQEKVAVAQAELDAAKAELREAMSAARIPKRAATQAVAAARANPPGEFEPCPVCHPNNPRPKRHTGRHARKDRSL